ncbi:hypothetical protein ACFWJM_10615, partial [Streptomyces sp. NPDC127077]
RPPPSPPPTSGGASGPAPAMGGGAAGAPPPPHVSGHVTALRQLPLRSSCSGTFEAEGIDYDRRSATLRVIVVSPGFCVLTDSKTYRFTKS